MGGILEAIASYNPQGMALQNQLRQAQIQGEQAQTQLQQGQAQAVGLENYRRQIENRDMGILGDAFRAANGDPTKAIPIAMNNGLSPIGYFKYQGEANSQAQQLLALSQKQREEMDARTHDMGDQLEALKAMPQTQRADAASSAIANYQKLYPGVAVDPNDFTTDAGLTKLTVPLNYWKYHLTNAKTQAETLEAQQKGAQAQAEAAKAQVEQQAKAQETAIERRGLAGDELAAIPTDANGNVDPTAFAQWSTKYKDVLPPAGIPNTRQAVQQFVNSTIKAAERPKVQSEQLELDALQEFARNPQKAYDQIHSLVGNNPSVEQAFRTQFDSAVGLKAKAQVIQNAGQYVTAIQQHIAEQTDPRIIGAEVGKQIAVAKALRANDSPALQNVAIGLQPAVTNTALKLDQDYINKNAAVEQMGKLLDLAEAGNKGAAANLNAQGAAVTSILSGFKRVMPGLAQENAQVGSVWDQMEKKLDKVLTGKAGPESLLEDVRTLHQTLGQASYDKYLNDLNSLNQRTGAKFQPVQPAPNIRRQAGGPAMGGYEVGVKYAGKQYLGGDPHNPANWK